MYERVGYTYTYILTLAIYRRRVSLFYEMLPTYGYKRCIFDITMLAM